MNSNKLNSIMNIVKFGLAFIGVIVCMLIISGPNGEQPMAEQAAFREGAKLGAAISYTGILMFACAAVIVLFFIVALISNTKRTIYSIIGIIVAFVIYFVITMMGTSDTNATLALRDPVSASTINTTSAGIYTIIIGLILSILAILLGPFMGRLRK